MLLYWFLPMILFLGIVTSYEDIKFGKIRNKWIILSIIYFIFINVILIILKLADISIFLKSWIGGVAALFIGYIIWHAGLWNAGDAKLFFAYSLLAPSVLFINDNFQYFTFINILINTFVPVSFFYFLSIVFKTTINQKIQHLKAAVNPKMVFLALLYAFGFLWALRMLFDFLKLETNNLLIGIILLIFYSLFFRLAGAKSTYLLMLIAILRLFFDKSAVSYDSMKFFLLISIFIIAFRYFTMLSYETFTKNMPIKNLRTGMIPAEIIFWYKKNVKKIKLTGFMFSRKYFRKMQGKSIFGVRPEGITSEEVRNIKNMKMPFKRLRIYRTSNFAIYLFIGVIITIILNGNIFTLIT